MQIPRERLIRQEKGMTQREMARYCGVSRTAIQAIEQGRGSLCKLLTLQKIASSLGVRYAETLLDIMEVEEDGD